MMFAERVAALTPEQRLHFYELLSHNLTVAVRSVWSDGAATDAQKVERMREINEVLHRATAKVWVLRLKTHEWTEEDFGWLLAEAAGQCPAIAGELLAAVERSYRAAAGEDIA